VVTLKSVEVINMAKQPNQTQSGTNIQHVRQQNAQSAGAGAAGQGQFGTEFASETDVQEVRQRNQQAEANKAKNSGQFGGQSR
jgi:small acid-soluble spore protein E (minor gamma-type SASP)